MCTSQRVASGTRVFRRRSARHGKSSATSVCTASTFDAKAGFGTKPVLAMSGDAILPLASRNTTAVLDVSTKFVGPKTLQKAVQVIKAGGMTFELTAESAHKFADAVQQSKYAHVNLKMPNGLAKDATGLFAELAGAQPMSDATKALLRTPK